MSLSVGLVGRNVSVDGVNFHVYEGGKPTGEALVFLHGYLTSALTWRQIYREFLVEYRVILVDFPGCGNAEAPPPDRDWSATAMAQLMHALFRVLGLESPTLIGSQMGGSLAAWYGALYPTLPARLVIMAAGALGEGKKNTWLYKLLAHPLWGRWICRNFPRGLFLKRWQTAHGSIAAVDFLAFDSYFKTFRNTGEIQTQIALGVRKSFGSKFDVLAPKLRNVKQPCLLVWGDNDAIVPLETGRRFQSLLVNSRLKVIHQCGDFPQEEAAMEVAKLLQEFLVLNPVAANSPLEPEHG